MAERVGVIDSKASPIVWNIFSFDLNTSNHIIAKKEEEKESCIQCARFSSFR